MEASEAQGTQRVTDYDELAGPPKLVRIGGREYELPADIPVDLFFEMAAVEQRLQDPDVDDVALLRDTAAKVLDLFRVHQPGMERLPAGLGIKGLLTLVGREYRGPGEAEVPPTTAAATAGETPRPETEGPSGSSNSSERSASTTAGPTTSGAPEIELAG